MSTQLVLVPTCDQVTQEAGTQDAHYLCVIVVCDLCLLLKIPLVSICVCVRVASCKYTPIMYAKLGSSPRLGKR